MPHDVDGKVIPGGPWLRAGETNATNDGKFWQNHGKIAIATVEADSPPGKASVFIGPATKLNEQLLRQVRGLKNDVLFVPFSNSEEPGFAKDYLYDMHKLRELMERPGIELATHSVKATGMLYKEPGDATEYSVMGEAEGKYLGTYNVSPTKVLVIVDLEGNQYVRLDNEQVRKTLEANGFHKAASLHVPFAKGETAVEPTRDIFQLRMNRGIEDPEVFVNSFQLNAGYIRGMKAMGGKAPV
ncbi:MAG: hypothetical protein K2Q01_00660 [Rickettsiales bacterium]|nr:hypothetical protein [Rickettsiales bacterium]